MRLLTCNVTSSTLVRHVVSAEIASAVPCRPVGNVLVVRFQGQKVGRGVKSKTIPSVSLSLIDSLCLHREKYTVVRVGTSCKR